MLLVEGCNYYIVYIVFEDWFYFRILFHHIITHSRTYFFLIKDGFDVISF
jgi:hypothetical protein